MLGVFHGLTAALPIVGLMWIAREGNLSLLSQQWHRHKTGLAPDTLEGLVSREEEEEDDDEDPQEQEDDDGEGEEEWLEDEDEEEDDEEDDE